MIRLLTRFLRDAMDSSAAVRVARRVVQGSVFCQAVASVVGWVRRTRRGIITGLGGEWSSQRESAVSERVDRLASSSRIVSTLSWLIDVPQMAWRQARVRQMLEPVLSLELAARVRLAGCSVAVATLTQTIVLAAVGVPVQQVGWGIRVAVAAAGLILVWRPEPFAAAWKDRTSRRTTGRSA